MTPYVLFFIVLLFAIFLVWLGLTSEDDDQNPENKDYD